MEHSQDGTWTEKQIPPSRIDESGAPPFFCEFERTNTRHHAKPKPRQGMNDLDKTEVDVIQKPRVGRSMGKRRKIRSTKMEETPIEAF